MTAVFAGFLLLAVQDAGGDSPVPEWQKREASSRLVERKAPQGDPEAAEVSPFRFIAWSAVVLGLIGAAYFAARRWKRAREPALSGTLLRILARKRVNPSQEVVILEAAGKILLIGAGKDGLSTLATLDEGSPSEASKTDEDGKGGEVEPNGEADSEEIRATLKKACSA